MAVSKSGKNPVLAHLFLNYLLDLDNALENISFNGYMQPLTGVTPQKLVAEQILPPNLSRPWCFRRTSDRGVSELELAPAVDCRVADGLEPVLRRPVASPAWPAENMSAGGDVSGALLAQVASRDRRPRWLWAILAGARGGLAPAALRPPVLRRPRRRGGTVNPIFQSPMPVWNPLQWSSGNFAQAWHDLVGNGAYIGPPLLRTVVYTAIASVLCLVIAYPVAYFVTRFAGRRKTLFLVLLIAPFWVSYMMRMLAWIDLLSPGRVRRPGPRGPAHHAAIRWTGWAARRPQSSWGSSTATSLT